MDLSGDTNVLKNVFSAFLDLKPLDVMVLVVMFKEVCSMTTLGSEPIPFCKGQ